MRSRMLIGIIALSCCFFESMGRNINGPTIGEKLGKRVFIYSETYNGVEMERLCYTTELCKALVTHDSLMKRLPIIGPLFDNRFEDFIENTEKFSQRELQEAIEDALLLSDFRYNLGAYSPRKLLNFLYKALQDKVDCIKDQIEHDFKWDQKSFNAMKKAGAWAIGLIACKVVTPTYDHTNKVRHVMSNLEALNAIASLGLLPVSYKIVKNCYRMLTICPHACNQHLYKYEELLAFVEKLKSQLERDGFITFELNSGDTATVKDDVVIFN